MAALDEDLQDASFGGVTFPCTALQMSGKLRHHLHEYLRTPGADVESLGRSAYEISMEAVLHSGLPRWPQLVRRLDQLLQMFASGEPYPLFVPTIGEILAKCISVTWKVQFSVISGGTLSLVFVDHQQQADLVNELALSGAAQLDAMYRQFIYILEQDLPGEVDLFSALAQAVGSVMAYVDQVELAGNLLATKVNTVVSAYNQIDRRVSALNEPRNHRVTRAFNDVGNAAATLFADLSRSSKEVRTFVTERDMTIGEVAIAVHGSTKYVSELLGMNELRNPLSIPPDTTIQYHPR